MGNGVQEKITILNNIHLTAQKKRTLIPLVASASLVSKNTTPPTESDYSFSPQITWPPAYAE
jgi:hypothetical protein